jgi:hypothetical protein
MSKMIFKNIKKKHHWHAFQHKKLFEKQPLPHCQALSKWGQTRLLLAIYLAEKLLC